MRFFFVKKHIDPSTLHVTIDDMRAIEIKNQSLCLAELPVPAAETLFVGDGANDELGGASRAGMTPVLIHPGGAAPRWHGLEDWNGLRITSIPQVLDLVA